VNIAVIAVIARRLAAAGCIRSEDEARELSSAAPDEATLERWVRRREGGEPLAWIVGSVSFCGRRSGIDPGVYVPRPQTEALARRAAELLPGRGRAADLCTGSGAIASHLMREVPSAHVVATDADPVAVACARRNGVVVVRASLGATLRDSAFDVITAVAPYVPTDDITLLPEDVRRHEPLEALDGGADGLDVVRTLVADAARLLRPGGRLLTELGDDQDVLLAPALMANGFAPAEPWFDEEGDLRGIAVRRE
jgi:release factor glutamine methyltransferase